jgi:hypothetical protein
MELTGAMSELEQTQDKLVGTVQVDRHYPIWVYGLEAENDPRLKLIEAIRSLDYLPGQGGTESLLFPALVGASSSTLDSVRNVNLARNRLSQTMRRFKGIDVMTQDRDTGDMIKRQWLRVVLSMLGHGKLNQRQATRIFRCLDKRPQQMSYSWVNLRKVSYTTVGEVRVELEKKFMKQSQTLPGHIKQEYEKLASLDVDEPLAIVTPLREQVRANVAWSNSDQGITKRAQFYASAPIFFPARLGDALPRLRKLPTQDAPRSFRLQRSDLKLELEPIITSQRIYRYRPEYREQAKHNADERRS